MSSLGQGGVNDPVESKTINAIREKNAKECHRIIKELLKSRCERSIDAQNMFGWTPLMQAIRNGDIEAVKSLLETGCDPQQSTYQGISAITMAVAVSREMFEIVYKACPSALEKSRNDNTSPLCVAAMKNDKDLFFRLIELGLQVPESSDFTLLMMGESEVPEIAKLGENQNIINGYWQASPSPEETDIFDDEDLIAEPQLSSTLLGNENSSKTSSNDSFVNNIPSVSLNLLTDTSTDVKTTPAMKKTPLKNLMSPRLEYHRQELLPVSPKLVETLGKREIVNDSGFVQEKIHQESPDLCPLDDIERSMNSKYFPVEENKLHKFQINRPPNLEIVQQENMNEWTNRNAMESVMSQHNTPITFCYEPPGRRIGLDDQQKKMANVLKQFGLTHFIPIFVEQEVDVGLFLSLNDRDLQEIGIEKKTDRTILLSVIEECNRNKLIMGINVGPTDFIH